MNVILTIIGTLTIGLIGGFYLHNELVDVYVRVAGRRRTPARDRVGTVRRALDGRLAVLWATDGHPARWLVTDWHTSSFELDQAVAGWPVVGAVPYSPASHFLPFLTYYRPGDTP